MLRQLYEVFMRLVRPEHPCVLATAASNLGSSLCGQGEPADARDADPARGAGCTKARARGGGYAHADECELE